MKKVRVVSLAYVMPTFIIFASTKYYQNTVFQTINKLWSAQEFG